MNKFKEKITKQLIYSYLVMLASDFLISLLYMLIYNYLLIHIINNLKNINILQAYLIFYVSRLVCNRTKLKTTVEEEIFDSFKRNILKFVHHLFWGFIIKLLFICCL